MMCYRLTKSSSWNWKPSHTQQSQRAHVSQGHKLATRFNEVFFFKVKKILLKQPSLIVNYYAPLSIEPTFFRVNYRHFFELIVRFYFCFKSR